MLRTILSALCAACCFIASAQLSGNVNTYYKVTAVPNSSYVTVSNASGVAALDRVMIVQMKGATIDQTANSSSFGTVSNLNNAGNYELATICKVVGNDVYFVNTISRTYDVAGKVQLVKIPKYASATVNGSLQPTPWDNASGTGGVMAISVSGTLTLNANINADGKGFKGGSFMKSIEPQFGCVINRTDYSYDPTQLSPQKGAEKGESVADLATNISGGRGAAANGGGGGNNHNNGGGGGSNLTAGGIGGGNMSTQGCPGSYPGLGGKALSNTSNTKIFLGGGGGAGHANNYAVVGGGNGGGIIYIEAASIQFNGYKIQANGGEGSYTIGDGASGGGAAGTIILNIGSYIDNANIEAIGGKGGDEDESENSLNRCFGEGGGGSGGAIYFKGAQPSGTVNVAGGVKGQRLNTQCTTGALAANGTSGLITSNYTIQQSTTPTPCAATISLPVQLISFSAVAQNKIVKLQWQVVDPQDADHYTIQRKTLSEPWKDVATLKGDAKKDVYETADAPATADDCMYRLVITEKDGHIIYSPIRYISFNRQLEKLNIYPNPVTNAQEITIQYNFKGGDAVKIFDAAGRNVLQKQLLKNETLINLNISTLQKGMYLVQTADAVGRLIVQ